MNDFEITQTLATRGGIKVFEARSRRFKFPVVLKQCEYVEDSEAEFFIRSALMKARNQVYSQPLLSIFADIDPSTKKSIVVFVWRKGRALDLEVERDQQSQFPPGKAGFGRSKVLYMNPLTQEAVKRTKCLTLGIEVVLKISKHVGILDMNSVFKEALALAKCAHANICDFFDFRLYLGKDGRHRTYIVMESLMHNLAMEVQARKSQVQPYEEAELLTILQAVTAGLLHAKSQGLAHQDIKPHNILRGPQAIKLADFGSTWLKGAYSRTSSAAGTEMYMSPEAWDTLANPENLQRPFESDVFSLGMTMLHLAAMELPPRTPKMSDWELQALLQRYIQALNYSEGFKRLLTSMLSIAPSDRPQLESVREEAERINSQATLLQEAHRLRQLAFTSNNEGNYAKGVQLSEAADALYSQLPAGMHSANNLSNWGFALESLGRSAEAVAKHGAAAAIYSRLPDSKEAAVNLNSWGITLQKMERSAEAIEKFAAADKIYSRLCPEDINTAINLSIWGFSLHHLEQTAEAAKKYAAADSIYSRYFPNDTNTANNLFSWGLALKSMGKWAEAARKLASASVIYALSEQAAGVRACGEEMAQLR